MEFGEEVIKSNRMSRFFFAITIDHFSHVFLFCPNFLGAYFGIFQAFKLQLVRQLFFFRQERKKDVGLSRSDTDDLSRCKREKETSGGRCIMVD